MNYDYETVVKKIDEVIHTNERQNDPPIIRHRKRKHIPKHKPCYGSIYTITHLIVSFFAVYLSWRCNNGKFDLTSFIFALLCPHLYVIYALAVNGGCGIFDSVKVPLKLK